MIRLATVFCLSASLFATTVFARPGDAPFPAQQRLIDYSVTSGLGTTSIIIESNGQVVAETYTRGHEFPDRVEDRQGEVLPSAERDLLLQEVLDAASTKLASAPDQLDWSPLLGGVYHVYSINGQTQVIKQWGGRVAGYAAVNSSPAATSLIQLLDGLYQAYFPTN